jgi:hypothetical protein
MKISTLFCILSCFLISSCSTLPSRDKDIPKKAPMDISFYSNGSNPHQSYTVLGHAFVSKFNKVGNKRQEACIHDAMRSAAASLGGDAVIDIRRNDRTVTGTIIAYQPQFTV